jgi:protein-arginine kinase activator protein McsA
MAGRILTVRLSAPKNNMLCDMCQKRDATIHTTKISGDVLKKSDLCDECFETSKPTDASNLAAALKAGCRYCGGEPYTGSGNSGVTVNGAIKLSFMCKPCAEEYFRFLRLKMPGFGSAALTKEQAAKLAKHNCAAILTELTEAEEHMKKWLSERNSQ